MSNRDPGPVPYVEPPDSKWPELVSYFKKADQLAAFLDIIMDATPDEAHDLLVNHGDDLLNSYWDAKEILQRWSEGEI